MVTACKLAGFFAAHAIWSVSDGETLIPMFAFTKADDKREMERLVVTDDLEASVTYGREKLESNPMDADDAVLLFDGRIPVGTEKLDAIIIEMRAYFSPDSQAALAIPYTPKSSGRFRVHKPKLLVWKNCDDFDMNAVLQSFFEGVDSHEQGARIWSDCLDQSK